MRVMLTGGAGYIGSHVCIELLKSNYQVVIFDNFSNSHREVIERIQHIVPGRVSVVDSDIRDQDAIERALLTYRCQSVVHLAGLKAVGDSVVGPLKYYDNNVVGSLRLLMAMKNCGVQVLVFSSSATVYGVPQRLPLTEDHPLSVINPYGRSKLIIESHAD